MVSVIGDGEYFPLLPLEITSHPGRREEQIAMKEIISKARCLAHPSQAEYARSELVSSRLHLTNCFFRGPKNSHPCLFISYCHCDAIPTDWNLLQWIMEELKVSCRRRGREEN